MAKAHIFSLNGLLPYMTPHFSDYRSGRSTETYGDNAANKGHRARMSNDNSFKIVTNRNAVLFTTETGASDSTSNGQRMVMHDDGRLIIYARDHRTPVYEFGKGKL